MPFVYVVYSRHNGYHFLSAEKLMAEPCPGVPEYLWLDVPGLVLSQFASGTQDYTDYQNLMAGWFQLSLVPATTVCGWSVTTPVALSAATLEGNQWQAVVTEWAQYVLYSENCCS